MMLCTPGGGVRGDVHLGSEKTVRDLKEKLVEEKYHRSSYTMRLLLGNVLLRDENEKLEALVRSSWGRAVAPDGSDGGEHSLLVTVVYVSPLSERIRECLSSAHSRTRCEAIQTLGWFGGYEDLAVREVLLIHLSDADYFVRDAVARALEPKNEQVISALLDRVSHEDWRIRCGVVQALAEVAGFPQNGTRRDVVRVVAGRAMWDEDRQVRHEAVSALRRVAEKGDAAAIAALLSCVAGDADSLLRTEAMQVLAGGYHLSSMVEKGNEEVIAAFLQRVTDEDWEVLREAVLSLARVTEKGCHRGVIRAVSDLVTDSDRSLRKAALDVLPQVCEKADEEVIATLLSHLLGNRPGRNEVAKLLASMVDLDEKGNGKVIAALLARVADKNPHVRRQVAHALRTQGAEQDRTRVIRAVLGLVAEDRTWDVLHGSVVEDVVVAESEKGDEEAIAAFLTQLLKDKNLWHEVAEAFLSVVGEIQKGNEEVIAALLDRLADKNRGGIVRALVQVAEKGCRVVIGAVLGLVTDKSGDVRTAAINALVVVAEKGDEEVIAAILGRVADGDSNVRRAAVKAVPTVVGKGDPKAIAALLARVADDDSIVRWYVVEALAEVAEKGEEKSSAVPPFSWLGRVRRSHLLLKVIRAVSGLVTDPDHYVREAALTALNALEQRKRDEVGLLHRWFSSLRPHCV